MKKTIFTLCSILLFIAMLIFPSSTKNGAMTGLNLWLYTLLPTLLPFMIISGFIMETGGYKYISFILSPITRFIFGLSKNAGYAMFIGFLCGYPMGSKVTADMVKRKIISKDEGQLLLSFCNNVSPAFLTAILIRNILNLPSSISLKLTLIMFLSPLLCGFIISLFYRKYKFYNNTNTFSQPNKGSSLIDTCILQSFDNIFKLGGYIIIFSIINEMLFNFVSLGLFSQLSGSTLSTILEITSGLNRLSSIQLDKYKLILYACSLTSFGGICAIAQTYSMIQNSGLSLPKYILSKILCAITTLLLIIMLI